MSSSPLQPQQQQQLQQQQQRAPVPKQLQEGGEQQQQQLRQPKQLGEAVGSYFQSTSETIPLLDLSQVDSSDESSPLPSASSVNAYSSTNRGVEVSENLVSIDSCDSSMGPQQAVAVEGQQQQQQLREPIRALTQYTSPFFQVIFG